MIALVALPRLRIVLCLMALVGRQRSADIDSFLELTLLVTTHVALAGSGIDQFALAQLVLLRFLIRDQLST